MADPQAQIPTVPLHGTTALTVQEAELERKFSTQHAEVDAQGKETTVAVPVSAYVGLDFHSTLKTFWKTTMFCVLALFLACSDGFQFQLPGNLVAQTSFIAQFGTIPTATGVALDAQAVAAWGGIYSAGYISALLLGGYPADWFGRKFNMALLSVLMAAAIFIEMFSTTWQVWGIAKLLNGWSVGLCQMTLSTYVSEMAPVQLRGALLVCYSFWWAFGQFTCAIAIYIIQTMPDAHRLYLRAVYSEWVFSGLAIFIVAFIPESPRWHLRKGNKEKAAKVLKRCNGSIPGYDVDHELSVLEYDLAGERVMEGEAAKTSYLDIFKGVNLRRTLVSSSIMCYQQTVGISIVYGYNAVFFKAAGLKNPFLGTVIIQIISLVMIFNSGYMVDKFGRRPLLLTGGVGIIVCLVIIGSLAFLPAAGSAGTATIAVMCIWVVFYTSSVGPCGYLLLGESSTPALRAKTTGFAAGCSGMFGLIFNYSVPLMILTTGKGAVGWGIKTAYFFACLAMIGLVLVYFFVPEHKNRTFAELNELYDNKVSARKFRQTKTTVQMVAEGAGGA